MENMYCIIKIIYNKNNKNSSLLISNLNSHWIK